MPTRFSMSPRREQQEVSHSLNARRLYDLHKMSIIDRRRQTKTVGREVISNVSIDDAAAKNLLEIRRVYLAIILRCIHLSLYVSM